MEDHQSPLIDEIATDLRKPLEDPYPFDTSGKPRAPNKFDQKLDETCKSRERNVLLDAGFQAWFAYIQAQRRTQLDFDQLPDSEARGVARYLCTIKPHPTVEILFQHVLYLAFRGTNRRAQLQASNYHNFPADQHLEVTFPGSAAPVRPHDIGGPQLMDNLARRNNDEQQQGQQQQQQSTSSGEAASPQLQTTSEPRAMDDHRRRSSTEQQDPHNTNGHPNNSNNSISVTQDAVPRPRLAPSTNAFGQDLNRLPPLPNRPPNLPELPPAGRGTGTSTGNHSWAFPKAKSIPSLLPNLTCNSVVKSDSLATVRMIFGDTPSQCHLEIDVYGRRVPYIARELFGLTFEEEDGRLSMSIVESGSRMGFEEVTLSGADRAGTEKLFGKVFQIVKEDPLYVDEIESGQPVSSLISLDIRGKAGDPSCLKIRSTAQTMAVIAKKLWPQFPFLN